MPSETFEFQFDQTYSDILAAMRAESWGTTVRTKSIAVKLCGVSMLIAVTLLPLGWHWSVGVFVICCMGGLVVLRPPRWISRRLLRRAELRFISNRKSRMLLGSRKITIGLNGLTIASDFSVRDISWSRIGTIQSVDTGLLIRDILNKQKTITFIPMRAFETTAPISSVLEKCRSFIEVARVDLSAESTDEKATESTNTSLVSVSLSRRFGKLAARQMGCMAILIGIPLVILVIFVFVALAFLFFKANHMSPTMPPATQQTELPHAG